MEGYLYFYYGYGVGIKKQDSNRFPRKFKLSMHSPKQWTLFLDRDGVINQRKVGGYIRTWSEFFFLEGALSAIAKLNKYFAITIVVTNQQGVAKGIMTENSLIEIHQKMLKNAREKGAQINRVYYCTKHQSENPICRKPNTGMGHSAKRDFPQNQSKQAVMVGDSPSDIQFGKNLGMKTVFLTTRRDIETQVRTETLKQADLVLSSLAELKKARHLSQLLARDFINRSVKPTNL